MCVCVCVRWREGKESREVVRNCKKNKTNNVCINCAHFLLLYGHRSVNMYIHVHVLASFCILSSFSSVTDFSGRIFGLHRT